MPARRDGFDTRRPNQIQPSVVSTEHAGLLTRAVVVRVHPEGPVTIVVGSWRNWQTRHVQTVQIGVRIPASRPSQRDRTGTIPRGRGAARVAASLSAKSATGSNPVRPARMGAHVAEGRDGDLGSLISSGMRVRFPPPRPKSRFVQWKDGGLTSRSRGFDSLTGHQCRWWAKANGAPRGCEPRSSRFDSGRSPQALGSLGNWQPTCFGRRSVEARVLPTRPLPDRDGRTAASDVADRGPSPRSAAGLIR